MVGPDSPQHDDIIWSMRFAGRIAKTTNTHLECVIIFAFSRQ